jgi:Protein kinase domain
VGGCRVVGTSFQHLFRFLPGISVPRWDGYHQVQIPEITRAWREISPGWGFAVSGHSPGREQGGVVSGDDHGADDGLVVSFAAGSRIAGYRLEERIGQGGMAVVFRARDEQLGRLVALKILAPALAGDAEFQRRFTSESRAAAAIDDPHIVPVFAAGEADGVLFIAMRYVAGGDAQSLLKREGPLPPARVAAIISPVASALDAAHRAGLVHRDVKPSNMLMDVQPGRPDHVYLSDFGLSKAVASTSGMTRAGTVLGTLDYISPEQIGGKPVDGRADQYALACSAFELLAGAPPFRRDEPTAAIYAHLSEPPPQLASRRLGLPRAVDGVLAKALAKAPGDRYGICAQFADALRDAFGFQPYSSSPGVMRAATHPPTETAWPPAEVATQSIDPVAGIRVTEDARALGHPLGSYDQTPATPTGTVPPVVTPAAPPTVTPPLVQGVSPPPQGPSGVPAGGYSASSGPGAPAGGQSQGPPRPTESGTGPGFTSPPPERQNRGRVIAAVAVAAVVVLYFAAAAVAHAPPFTKPTHPLASPTHSPTHPATHPPTPTPSPSPPLTQLLTGTGTDIGTLNLATGAESGSFTADLSPLGAVTGHENLTFTFPSASMFSYTGTRTLVTANGDEVFSTIEGSGTSVTSTTSHGTENDTVTGGTGRFTGASGTYTLTFSSVVAVTGNTETFDTTSTTHGNIRY